MNSPSPSPIEQELNELAAFYRPGAVFRLPNPGGEPLFDDYVEVVLAADHFEVVLGGIGRERELAALAQANGLAPGLVAAFEACAAQFSGKMLYAKFPYGAPGQPGSLYVVTMEPWEPVLALLQELGFPAAALADLRAAAGRSGLVFILGFSLTEAGELLAKVYHLFDRRAGAGVENGAGRRFLESHRLTSSGRALPRKYYDARVQWADVAAASPRWRELGAFAGRLYGPRYALLSGTGAPGAAKVYVLRHDRRQSHLFSYLTYNYYVEEGARLVQCQRLEAARAAFENALDFDPLDANAYNGLALADILAGNFLAGVESALRARELNPLISNYLWHAPVPPQAVAEAARLSAELAGAPSADKLNERGVQYFLGKQYAAAEADFRQALALNDLHADAYNNLAGTCLKTGRFAEAVKAAHVARNINRGISAANWEVARQAMQFSRELAAGPSAPAFNNLGVLYYQLDLYDEARRCFEQALALPAPAALPTA